MERDSSPSDFLRRMIRSRPVSQCQGETFGIASASGAVNTKVASLPWYK